MLYQLSYLGIRSSGFGFSGAIFSAAWRRPSMEGCLPAPPGAVQHPGRKNFAGSGFPQPPPGAIVPARAGRT